MNDIETLVREELRRDDAVPDLLPEVMVARVRTIRRRNTIAGLAAAGTAVITAATLLVSVPALTGRSTDPAGSSGSPIQHTVDNLTFVDRRTGFAVIADCPQVPPDRPEADPSRCGRRLLATENAGESWHRLTLPERFEHAGHRGIPALSALSALSATTLVLTDEQQQWLSTDAGRSWRQQRELTTTTTIPQGAQLILSSETKNPLIDVVDRSGQVMRLQTPSDTKLRHSYAPSGALTAASDGSYWMLCDPGGEGAGSCLVRITEQGRNWEKLAALPKTTASAWVYVADQDFATLDGKTVYLSATVRTLAGRDSTTDQSLLLRSTDAGHSWNRIDLPTGSRNTNDLAILPNGDLLIATDRGIYRCRAGTDVLIADPTAPPADYTVLFRSGPYLIDLAYEDSNSTSTMTYRVSEDGSSWRELRLPN